MQTGRPAGPKQGREQSTSHRHTHRLSPLRNATLALAAAALLVGGGTGCTTSDTHTVDSAETRRIEQAAARRSPLVGKKAAAFTLPNQDEQPVSLEDFRGQWVVLYFYPEDDTPGCMCQATEFTRILDDFFGLDAQVVGVSPDSPKSHRQFIKKHALAFPLLSDPSHDVMRQYGAWVDSGFGPGTEGRVLRTTFLIDPQGRIAYHWPEVIPQGHAQRVRNKLEELRRVEPQA